MSEAPRPRDPVMTRAVALLRAGRLVAFPTETVYGLGADAANEQAVRRLFSVKGRPADHPVIVHLPDASHMGYWAADVPPSACKLAAAFWPGPLTLVLRRAAHVSDAVTGGQNTVGLRVPRHWLALDLLRAFGGAIAAPSANRFGRLSPTTAEHVRAELGGDVELVLDGGSCEVGIESTIVDLSGSAPSILRPGRVSAEEIARVIGTEMTAAGVGAPRASGRLAAHYAPRTAMRVVSGAALGELIAAQTGQGKRLAVLARPATALPAGVIGLTAPDTPAEYGRVMYGALRALDEAGADVLLVESVPDEAPWLAVRDRLARAARRDLEDDGP
jgi:L-threonylcarbamoyladenylate synthase